MFNCTDSKCCLHAALPLGVGTAKLRLVEAVDTLSTVILNQTALAGSAAPGTDSSNRITGKNLPFFEPVAPSPPPSPPLDGFLRDDPLRPALISEVIVIVCHIWRQETQMMG